MNENIRWNEDELTEKVKSLPVNLIRNENRLAEMMKKEGLNKIELAALLTFVAVARPDFRLIKVKADSEITFGKLCETYELAQTQFIIIHRCNYILHEAMITVYDILERDKRLRFTVKKFSQEAEKQWHNYEEPRRKNCGKSAWYTLQDHLRIANDFLSPKLEKVYESLRNYMISLGWRDVETKARIEVVLLLAKVAHHSFNAFFKEFEDHTDCDFSKCFANSDLSTMVSYFAKMSDALGIKTAKDKYGIPDLKDIITDKSVRVQWAWDDFIKDLQDNDLMDESALRAIELNPETAADYHRQLEEEEQQKIEASVDKLSEKFKVKKSNKK